LDILLLSDPLINDYGPTRPVLLIGGELSKEHRVVVASPKISYEILQTIESKGMIPIDLGAKFHFKEGSKIWLETCLRETIWKSNSKKLMSSCNITEFKIISFTRIFDIPADIAYGQGVVDAPLKAMRSDAPFYRKVILDLIAPLTRYTDRKLVDLLNSTKIVIANSKFCLDLYEEMGIEVNDVIYPPLDCEKYKPSTSNPASDYVLSYAGKETQFSLLKEIADLGIKMKIFGSKASHLPKFIREHPSIENLGFVTEEELISLYTNAFYTLFPFNLEFFGYIPVESMACGTPVLTYAYQGPGETVKDNVTGWLVKDDDEMVRVAKKLKSNGYQSVIRNACRRYSLNFDVKHIANEWIPYVEGIK
jgi:glycosyltransferase involved in cell wall biosynthesis